MQSQILNDQNGKSKNLLRQHHLKITTPRLSVLSIISKKETATSQPELEKILGDTIDRVTLYRVLNVFEEKGILHKIHDLHGTATYAICSENCPEHMHKEEHVHFTCSECNSIYCLDDNMQMPTIAVPKGFHIDSISINAIGICDKCRKKKSS